MVTEQRTAFPPGRVRTARTLQEGDGAFLWTTRGCFRNPTRDLGRVTARASVAGPVRTLGEPVVFGDRSSTEGRRLEVSGPTPFRDGPVLRDLVPRLSAFQDPATRSVRRRRAALALPPEQAGAGPNPAGCRAGRPAHLPGERVRLSAPARALDRRSRSRAASRTGTEAPHSARRSGAGPGR
ncbi:hypothetical protein GCM10010398_49370 [Streptomyces fimbriatus]